MAEVLLSERKDAQEKDYLVFKIRHNNGVYRLTVTKETEHTRNGYGIREFLLFATGSFNATLSKGRKSQKKLDTYNRIVEDNKEHYTELWKNGKYSNIYEDVILKSGI